MEIICKVYLNNYLVFIYCVYFVWKKTFLLLLVCGFFF